MAIEFSPVRWWQVAGFIRLNLEMVRGRDPWADRILAQPWSFYSLLEYGYLLDTFFRSDNYYILVDDERAGVVALGLRSDFAYIYSLILLPHFQGLGLARRVVSFIDAYAHHRQSRALVAAMAVGNKPVNRLVKFYGGRPLGLATTTLANVNFCLTAAPPLELQANPLPKVQAKQSWQRWRLYEVEYIAGLIGVDIATCLMEWESFPSGTYLALTQAGQEVGFAAVQAHRRTGALDLHLFTSAPFWSNEQTAALMAVIIKDLKNPTIRQLTITRSHADVLTSSPLFRFERYPDQERHFAFKPL